MSDLVFIPGKPASTAGLLSRFLPPIPEGIAHSWLTNNLPPGSLVLDPFGSHPLFAVEGARAKYKILVSSNNPITRSLIELAANPPREEDMRSALANLASLKVGHERLEVHLKQLYMTTCTKCGQPVMAHSFVWERNSSEPIAKIYECHHCGDSGEHPVTQSDINLACSFSDASIHKMRVVERIAYSGGLSKVQVEEALSIYLPRALYCLVTLINKIESLSASPIEKSLDQLKLQRSLIALALTALDQGNNLWTYPSGRSRPKRFSPSPRFRENNIWLALEKAAEQLADDKSPLPFTIYPEFLESDFGVILFEGSFRELIFDFVNSSENKPLLIDAVLTALPRHNQAFWTLSALWSGWLWGHKAVEPFKSVFQRQRYDWAWYSSALSRVFKSLSEHLPSRIPFFGLIGEAETHYLSASIIPATSNRFTIKSIAMRAESGLAQVLLEQEQQTPIKKFIPSSEDKYNLQKLLVTNGMTQIKQRGEPAPYLTMYASALQTIVLDAAIADEDENQPGNEYNRIHSLIEDTLSERYGFIRYGGSEKSPEMSKLWHQEIIKPIRSLSDQVELLVQKYLVENPGCSFSEIDEFICSQFPGLMTPEYGLIETCIESYSEKDLLTKLTLRSQDKPSHRDQEVKDMRRALIDLGDRLNFSSIGEVPVIWSDEDLPLRLFFFVNASAAIGEIIYHSNYPPDRSFIVLPGARANIILYKLRYDPYLKGEIARGWRFLKFRHLRHLLDSPSLSKNNLDSLLEIDPLTESPAQLRLL